jgi:hypothetical protein
VAEKVDNTDSGDIEESYISDPVHVLNQTINHISK